MPNIIIKEGAMMKIMITVFLMLMGIGKGTAQVDSLSIYTLQTFEEYDFLDFGGQKEFLRSVYKRIKYPGRAREWKKEKEGVIRAVLRCNGNNDYDVFTFSDTEGASIIFHQEVHRVLSEIINLPNENYGDKYLMEMFFDFRINRECVYDNEMGIFCIYGISRAPKRNST